MFIYVAAGPDEIDPSRFLSRTMVDRCWAACEMLACRNTPLVAGIGVAAPVIILEPCGLGVVEPLFSCVAMADASLRAASEMICLMFLLRR